MLPVLPHYLIVIGTLLLGLTSKSTSSRRIFFFVALSIFLPIFATPHPDLDPSIKYQIGLNGSFIVSAAFNFLVLCSNPQDTLKHNKQITPVPNLSFFPRLKWAAGLLFNYRGVNWTHVVRGLRYPRHKTRWGFVFSQLKWVAFYFTLSDIVGAIMRRNPALHYPPTEAMSARGMSWQATNVILFWLGLVSLQNRMYNFISALSVAVGASDPEDWPAFFGVWLDTKSMRSFWGRSWHQCLRRSIQPHSKYLTQKILHLSPTSLTTTYIELYTCFFLSGLYHAAGDWVVQRNPETALVNIKYFVLQAVIMTLEDFLIFLGKKVGVTKVPTIVSYAWVLGWMTVTCPAWVESMVVGNNLSFAPILSVVEMIWSRFGAGL
ncbi:membrane bound O-acyl transferase family-domain-containing protein [Cyathus striatus]|nr:membrane bound O-acyl transferase family-domain-containing protein [Cyathus striatus]